MRIDAIQWRHGVQECISQTSEAYTYSVRATLLPMARNEGGTLDVLPDTDIRLLASVFGVDFYPSTGTEEDPHFVYPVAEDGGGPSLAQVGTDVLNWVGTKHAVLKAAWEGKTINIEVVDTTP